MKKNNHGNRRIYGVLVIVVVLISGIMIGFNIVQHRALNEQKNDAGEQQFYDYHIAMIVKDSSDVFWQSVYRAAREAGMKKGIYIESFGEELNEGYTTNELVEMAIAARVDGIILEADSSAEMLQLIKKGAALDPPIPVITIGSDAAGSQRISFVTANDYELGKMYGSQVLEALKENGGTVAVLLPSDIENSQPSLVYSGISEVLGSSTIAFKLTAKIIGENDEFGAEEQIRNLLLSNTGRPDAVVCLSAVNTISTSQGVVDYNLVGTVKIIGTYSSPEIIKGIQKGIIYSAVAVNSEEMGAVAAEGMYEYLTNQHISEYLSVQSELVSRKDIKKFMEEE